MFFKKKKKQDAQDDAPLSPEADALLAAATAEYDAKQEALEQGEWRLASCADWGFDVDTGTVTVRFEDGSQWQADGQFLGSFNPDDQSFQWAWDSPDMSEHLTRDSRVVKEVGERFGIRYLTMGGGCFPIPGTEFVDYLCSIGLKATDSIGVMEACAEGMVGFIMLKNVLVQRETPVGKKSLRTVAPGFCGGLIGEQLGDSVPEPLGFFAL